jgi:Uma2 family endonuclease
MEPARRQSLSENDYLTRERAAQVKHEYVNGELIAMAGASPQHNVVASNIAGVLREQLRNRPCLVLPSDQRVFVPATGLYAYPDVTVVCGRPEFHAKDDWILLNPVVIFEVLSESTEAFDRGAKFAHYRHLDSLAEYVLVAIGERRVEHYRRVASAQWMLTSHETPDAAVALPALGLDLPLAQIFEKLDLLPGS